MNVSDIARKALYGSGSKDLWRRAELIAVDLDALQELGEEKLRTLEGTEHAAKGDGYLVVCARHAMNDALDLLRRADKGRVTGDAVALDAQLRSTGEFEMVNYGHLAEFDGSQSATVDATERATPRRKQKLFDGRQAAGLDGEVMESGIRITRSSPIIEVGGRTQWDEARHMDRDVFSEKSLKELVDLLNVRERSVIDLTLLGQTQKQIAASLEIQQSYVSKLLHKAIGKLEASDHTELRALGWEARYAGREARRDIPGPYPHSQRVIKHGPSIHSGGRRRTAREARHKLLDKVHHRA